MSQNILLLKDVEHVGHQGEIAKVKSGYAFNYLVPKGLAMIATRAALRRQEKLREERRIRAEQEKKEALQIAEKLQVMLLEIDVKVDHEGHMYGSVSALQIVDLVREKSGIELEKRYVQLKKPIKEIGVFDVPLRFKEGVSAQIQVKITAQQEE